MADRDENMHGLVVDSRTGMLGATRWSRSLPMLPKTCCVCGRIWFDAGCPAVTASSRDASIAGRQRGLGSSGEPSPCRGITPSASSLPM